MMNFCLGEMTLTNLGHLRLLDNWTGQISEEPDYGAQWMIYTSLSIYLDSSSGGEAIGSPLPFINPILYRKYN